MCVRACARAHTYVCMYVVGRILLHHIFCHMCVCVCVCVCVCIYIYIYIYILKDLVLSVVCVYVCASARICIYVCCW